MYILPLRWHSPSKPRPVCHNQDLLSEQVRIVVPYRITQRAKFQNITSFCRCQAWEIVLNIRITTNQPEATLDVGWGTSAAMASSGCAQLCTCQQRPS